MMTITLSAVTVAFLVVTGCAAPTNAPTIRFGNDYDPQTFDLIGEKTQFGPREDLAFVATLREAPNAPNVRAEWLKDGDLVFDMEFSVLARGSTRLGGETDLRTFDLPGSGTYTLRIIKGSVMLAEGSFTYTE